MRHTEILLFDLDGTLLKDDKTISKRTIMALEACRDQGIRIGIASSRSEARSKIYIEQVKPDILILSGGAVVKYIDKYVFIDAFSYEETNEMIRTVKDACGENCGMTIDTLHGHYTNSDKHVGSTRTDFHDFTDVCLKMCVEAEEEEAKILAEKLKEYDCSKFFGENWYKFTKKTSTKENAIVKLSEASGVSLDEIAAFGDDDVDLGMIKLCGLGVAMGNSIEVVKQAADVVIGSNEEDGIAEFLEKHFLCQGKIAR